MEEKSFNEIFAGNLKRYMELYELSQSDVAKRLGVSLTSVANWMNAVKTPRMHYVDALCEIFHCSRSDLTIEFHDEIEATENQRKLLAAYCMNFIKLSKKDQKAVMSIVDSLLNKGDDSDE